MTMRGPTLAAAGVAVVVVAHPPQPYPYVFDSVAMASFLPLVATVLSVSGGVVVALDGVPWRRYRRVSGAVAPLWCVLPVAGYLVAVGGFGPLSPLVWFPVALGTVAGLGVWVILPAVRS